MTIDRNPKQSYQYAHPEDMAIKLSDETRDEAISAIKAHFLKERQEEIGNIAAGTLLDFILKQIGPSIYNQGVRDARDRVQTWVTDLDLDLCQTEFPRLPF